MNFWASASGVDTPKASRRQMTIFMEDIILWWWQPFRRLRKRTPKKGKKNTGWRRRNPLQCTTTVCTNSFETCWHLYTYESSNKKNLHNW
jgi:hypothetical protein